MDQEHDTNQYHKSSPKGGLYGQTRARSAGERRKDSTADSLPTLFELPDLSRGDSDSGDGSDKLPISVHQSHTGPPAGHVDPPSGQRGRSDRSNPHGPVTPPGHAVPGSTDSDSQRGPNHPETSSSPQFRSDLEPGIAELEPGIAASGRGKTPASNGSATDFSVGRAAVIILILFMVTLAFVAGRGMHRLGDSAEKARLVENQESDPTVLNSPMTTESHSTTESPTPNTASKAVIASKEQNDGIDITFGTPETNDVTVLTADELLSQLKNETSETLTESETPTDIETTPTKQPSDMPTFDEPSYVAAPQTTPSDQIGDQEAAKDDQPSDKVALGTPTDVLGTPTTDVLSEIADLAAEEVPVPEIPNSLNAPDAVVAYRGQESLESVDDIPQGMADRLKLEDALNYSDTPNSLGDLLGLAESLGIWNESPVIQPQQ